MSYDQEPVNTSSPKSKIPGYKEVEEGLMKDKEGKHSEAMKLYEKAGELGNKAAFLNMGNCYMFGKGISQDKKKAIEMYGKCGKICDDELEWIRELSNDKYVCGITLDLSYNYFGNLGAASIAEALKVNSTLKSLNLGSNWIEDSGAASIAEALKVNSTLLSLSLHYNAIKDSGAASIAEALKVNSSLTHLYLYINNVRDSGAMSLGEALKVNSTLTLLRLDKDKLGESGKKALREGQCNGCFIGLYDFDGKFWRP